MKSPSPVRDTSSPLQPGLSTAQPFTVLHNEANICLVVDCLHSQQYLCRFTKTNTEIARYKNQFTVTDFYEVKLFCKNEFNTKSTRLRT